MATKLESAIAHQQQKETQLAQWGEQAQAYQAWNQERLTAEMKVLAQSLSSPQIQEQLATISQQLQKQTQSARGQRSDHGQGLSI